MSADSSKYAIDLIKEENDKISVDTFVQGDGVLVDVRFHKEIYQPGCIEFKIDLGTATDVDKYKGLVTLKYGYTENYKTIAEKYHIFERKKTKSYLYCKAYSVDKYLTIDKFNQSFLGKKFVSEMIKTTLTNSNFSALNCFKNYVENDNNHTAFKSVWKITSSNNKVSEEETYIFYADDNGLAANGIYLKLNHLIYDTGVTENLKDSAGNEVKDPKGNSIDVPIYKEYILPYSVQYNESFYDFLVRMCNRYGEFLYCENNRLYIGLESGKIGHLSSLGEGTFDVELFEYCEDFTCVPQLTVPTYFDEYKSIPFVNNEGIVAEEYFNPIKDKDYAVMGDYTPPTSTAFDLLSSFGEARSLYAGIVSAGVKSTLKFSISGKFMHDINKKYNTLYFGENLNEECCNSGKTKKNEFATWDKYVNNEWYSDILEKEEKSENGKLIVKCTTYQDYLLGDMIEYGGKYYIVYSVKGGKEQDEDECLELLLVPEQTEEIVEKINDKDVTKKTIKVYPLPMKDLHIRKSAPQRAKVISNFDPERLGRVCVQYPWQYFYKEDDPVFAQIEEDKKEAAALIQNMKNSTPWIRVSYPMASNEAGFMFLPAAGDEVLIDYEGGNIERPFVAGSFYTKNNKPSVPAAMHTVGVTKSITSANGHHISFTDTPGGITKFIGEMIPICSTLSKFGVLSNWNPIELGRYLSGGFEIADYLGVYSITGSTHGRNITIKSPVGDVKIDAFSGITINAPLGDVNIVGKNVNIEARNNLTLTSGTNINQPYFGNKGEVGKSIFTLYPGAVSGMLKVLGVDLSFHRTWLEVLVRPIGGTMLIKSYRFLCLEGGEGNAKVPLSDEKENKENDKCINGLNNYASVISYTFIMLRKLKDRIMYIKDPLKEFQVIHYTDKENIKKIIKDKVNDYDKYLEIIEENKEKHSHYFNIVKSVQDVFTFLQSNKDVKKYGALKKMVEEYWEAYKQVEKDLLNDPNLGRNNSIQIQINSEYNVFRKDNCKRLMYKFLSEYVEGDKKLKTLIHMDVSKVNDWNNIGIIKNSIEVGPSTTTRLKLGGLVPIIKAAEFWGFRDDKWWKKLDKGGIVYSVSKKKYTMIAENDSQTHVNANVNLMNNAITAIVREVSNCNFDDINLTPNN